MSEARVTEVKMTNASLTAPRAAQPAQEVFAISTAMRSSSATPDTTTTQVGGFDSGPSRSPALMRPSASSRLARAAMSRSPDRARADLRRDERLRLLHDGAGRRGA